MTLFEEYYEKYRVMIKEKHEYFFEPKYWIASQYLADRDISATDIDEIKRRMVALYYDKEYELIKCLRLFHDVAICTYY